jgi:hypothetical protein
MPGCRTAAANGQRVRSVPGRTSATRITGKKLLARNLSHSFLIFDMLSFSTIGRFYYL